jgi:hypothetical protein
VPVFRAVALGGKVSGEALANDSGSRIVKRYARRVGLDPASVCRAQPALGVPHLGGGEWRIDLEAISSMRNCT